MFIKINLWKVFVIILFNIINVNLVVSRWNFAVSTESKILFYNNNFTEVTSAGHQYNEITAMAYDEVNDLIYFNDKNLDTSTIYSLKVSPNDNNHRIEKIIKTVKKSIIQGIAYDPLEKYIYWSDHRNFTISRLNINNTTKDPEVFLQFNSSTILGDIDIDICRRKLYWTNANTYEASIESASLNLNGSDRQIVFNKDLYRPHGVFIDQQSERIYWVDNKPGVYYAVESIFLNGTNHNILINTMYGLPIHLTVSNNDVYWTDYTYKTLLQVNKFATQNQPNEVLNFTSRPNNIIIRENILQTYYNYPVCRAIIKVIADDKIKQDKIILEEKTRTLKSLLCLNDGKLNNTTNTCDCVIGFEGANCEISKCHNYCVHGTCTVTPMNFPECDCEPGYSGTRCSKDACDGFCLHSGRCQLTGNGSQPVCFCAHEFTGKHCDLVKNREDLCQSYCHKQNTSAFDIDDLELSLICDDCRTDIKFGCQRDKLVLILVVGGVVSLSIIFLILFTWSRIKKPLRPKIKKTYVVHKNVTPLSCRSATRTEQCEITIEDCCNMNICDTPCFDPKAMEKEMKKDSKRKDDSRNLLNNIEQNELY